MASLIDATKPVAGSPTTQSVRDQFATARDEITALQNATSGAGTITAVSAGTGLQGGGVSGAVSLALTVPVAVTSGGTGAITAPAALANLGGISSNQTITLSGAVSGSGTTAIATTLATVPVSSGGTNATTAAAALTNLGAVAKAGDTMTGTLVVPSAVVGGTIANDPGTGSISVGATGGLGIVYLGGSGASAGRVAGNASALNLQLPSAGGATANIYNNAGGAVHTVSDTGNLTIAGATATKPGGGPWVAPSDRALKSAAVPWHTGLDEVLQLEVIAYKYNNAAWNLDQDYIGVDAEDAAAVIPEMGRIVSVPADDVVVVDPHAPPGGVVPPGHQTVEVAGVEFGPLVYALVNAVKELAARVEKLERPQ